MRASKAELEITEAGEGYEGRFAEWDGYTVSFETIPPGSDFGPLLRGLPNDACGCPHWGFCFRGTFVVRYTDGEEETIAAGQAYYMRPGHIPVYVEETETLEFSPTDGLRRTIEVVTRNLEAAGAA